MRKPWSTHRRNGIIQVQFYNYNDKRYHTAKSTGTRDMNEALHIISRWWIECINTDTQADICRTATVPSPIAVSKTGIDADIKTQLQAIYETLVQGAPCNKNTGQSHPISKADYEDAPEEIKPLLEKLPILTFYDYILLYWNYDKSPYIKSLIRKGEAPPNPERFRDRTRAIKKYAAHFPQCLLTEITGTKIDTALGSIKKAGKLKDNTMQVFRYIFIQSLRFAYRNNLIARDVAQQISREAKSSRKKAKKEAEKAIFMQEEIRRLFNSEDNPFGSKTYLLINELLFKTGCRIGELQALQMQDIVKTAEGYALNISKNYCRAGKRLKCTKTERSDSVPLSTDLAAKLLAHIEKHPFKNDSTALIFASYDDAYTPLSYTAIYNNFNKAMVKLGIKRQHLTLHSYRHTYATFLRMAGYSEEQLMHLTRHDSAAEVHHYTNHYTPDMERLKHQAAIDIEKIAA